MTAIRNFFDVNYELVLFAYGQVFFVLGLAIALQSRHHSQLELARNLSWLSLFGFAHGLYEWGFLLIPIQATYINGAGLVILQLVQVILLVVSYIALFQFGAKLLSGRWPRIIWLPAIMAAGWWLWFFIPGLLRSDGIGLWQQNASVWARYLLGFPGGLLAAYGLREQANRQIKPLQLTYIYNTVRVAGVALLIYAILSGLFVPYADFFPANRLNATLLIEWFGVPVPVWRAAAGLVIVVTMVRAMEVFDVEVDRLIEQMEYEQHLVAERDRIGRELHDGAIQQMYTAGLIIESARRKLADEDVVANRLERAMTTINEAIAQLRSYMGDLRDRPRELSLLQGLGRLVNDQRLTALMLIELELDLTEADEALSAMQVTHLLAIVGEALANAARHAQATKVVVRSGRGQANQLFLQIIDNGQGFDHQQNSLGYGLRNMRDRARLLGSELKVESAPGRGTTITIFVPNWAT